jgi:hypothetical protein
VCDMWTAPSPQRRRQQRSDCAALPGSGCNATDIMQVRWSSFSIPTPGLGLDHAGWRWRWWWLQPQQCQSSRGQHARPCWPFYLCHRYTALRRFGPHGSAEDSHAGTCRRRGAATATAQRQQQPRQPRQQQQQPAAALAAATELAPSVIDQCMLPFHRGHYYQ